jgi:hypothetical protein
MFPGKMGAKTGKGIALVFARFYQV